MREACDAFGACSQEPGLRIHTMQTLYCVFLKPVLD